MKKLQGKQLGYFMVFCAGTLWGSIGFFVSILKSLGADSFLIAFCRLFLGFLLLIPLLYYQGGTKAFKIDWPGLKLCILSGLLAQAAFNILYNECIKEVGVATASILAYTAPVFVTVMSWLFFKEKLGKAKYVALILNIVGCTLTVTGGNFGSLSFSVIGVIMGVGAGFFYAVMTILGKQMTTTYDPITTLFYSFGFGALFLLPVAQPWNYMDVLLQPKFMIIALGYGIFPAVGSYVLYMKGISKGLEASKVSVIASVETVVAALFGFIVFHESTTLLKLLGICFVFASIMAMNSEQFFERYSLKTILYYRKKKQMRKRDRDV